MNNVPEEWSEKDVAKLKSVKSPETSEEPRAPSNPRLRKCFHRGSTSMNNFQKSGARRTSLKPKSGKSPEYGAQAGAVPPVFQKPIVPSPP